MKKMKYLGEVKLITNDQDDHNFTSSFFFIFFLFPSFGVASPHCLRQIGSSVQAIGLSWSLSTLCGKWAAPIFFLSQKKRIDTLYMYLTSDCDFRRFSW